MIINADSVEEFRKDFNEAMKGLQDKYDITISLGSITYWQDRFTAKLTANNGRDSEMIARAEFDRNVWKYRHLGLEPGMYNRIFIGDNGEQYAIEGFKVKARKYPLEIVNIRTGAHERSTEDFIKELRNEYYVENHAEDSYIDGH